MAIFYHLDKGKWVMFMLNSTLSYVPIHMYKTFFLDYTYVHYIYYICLQRCARWKKSANSYSLFLPFRIPLVKWRPKLMTWAVRVSLTISEKGEKLCSCKQDLYSCTHPLCCVARWVKIIRKIVQCTVWLKGYNRSFSN